MGVDKLWPILQPAGQTCLLDPLAITEGFNRNYRNCFNRPGTLRVGIDVSIWMANCSAVFHHSDIRLQAGENPELRTLFFRLCHLLRAPITPIFVFDGPHRPQEKRGQLVKSVQGVWFTPHLKKLINVFGFKCHEAPAEAEAELAALNEHGLIDAIITDDCDVFAFGGQCVLRSSSMDTNQRIGGTTVDVYTADALENSDRVGLTAGGFILISLLAGGDYHQGTSGIGTRISQGLARCGFGDELVVAVHTLFDTDLSAFLHDWRSRVKQELLSNARGYLGSRHPRLAEMIQDDFPDPKILDLYVNPVTSWSIGEGSHVLGMAALWRSCEPSIPDISSFCMNRFGWSDFDKLLKVFQRNLWDGVVWRMFSSGTAFYNSDQFRLVSPNCNAVILKISKNTRRIKLSMQKTSIDYLKLTVSVENFVQLTGCIAPASDALKPISTWLPQQLIEAAVTAEVPGVGSQSLVGEGTQDVNHMGWAGEMSKTGLAGNSREIEIIDLTRSGSQEIEVVDLT